ncbi:hypothetical protein PRIPAC_97709 [Pristionchus pacificus]|uniref:dual-specificity kinase n=1 Tax=Pristionchus pacificus TaxID=54126 RepID=A0A2A6BC03_PRIPA|nr:hypothetical protein PRIPAC_97709 [Pristionchus pacificus]|eukprot:PDM63413.1 protein kinase [Pristionchus pacificus]
MRVDLGLAAIYFEVMGAMKKTSRNRSKPQPSSSIKDLNRSLSSTTTTQLPSSRSAARMAMYNFLTSVNTPYPATVFVLPEDYVEEGKENEKGLTPEEAIIKFATHLTPYEKKEILHYARVYFVGPNAEKIGESLDGTEENKTNAGYDDDNGFYKIEDQDHIAYRYEVKDIRGKGSFGTVVKAYDHKTEKFVAIKIVRNEEKFRLLAEGEIRILLVRKHARAILQCLQLLRANKLIHFDLKPENICLKQNGRSELKVIDFGASCYENQQTYTYIQSRHYRAPEVILRSNKYGTPIDMWSFGCVVAELIIGYPLLSGEDEHDQMALMIELLGMPPPRVTKHAKSKDAFISSKGHPRYCTVVTKPNGKVSLSAGRSKRGYTRGTPGSKTWSQIFRNKGDKHFVDFISRCLRWDPAQRLTPHQALNHKWITCGAPPPPPKKQKIN